MGTKDANMVAQIAEKDTQTPAKDAMYEACFCQLEAMMQSSSTPKVTQHKAPSDRDSLAHVMVRSLVGSGSGNAIFFVAFVFLLLTQPSSISIILTFRLLSTQKSQLATHCSRGSF